MIKTGSTDGRWFAMQLHALKSANLLVLLKFSIENTKINKSVS